MEWGLDFFLISKSLFYYFNVFASGLENITRPLVFTSASGCRASENFDISSENYVSPCMPIIVVVVQGKCLFHFKIILLIQYFPNT